MSWFPRVALVVAGLLVPAGLAAQQLSLVTAAPGGGSAGHVGGGILAMTPDEQYVAFCSATNSLDPTKADTNGIADVYRRHLPTGVTTLVSVNAAGTAAGNGGCESSAAVRISTDGRYVAFMSRATNLVTGITDTTPFNVIDLFVRDMQTGTTSLASVDASGSQAVGTNGVFDLSDDGHRVAFESYATTLVAGFVDGNGAGNQDVFLRDVPAATTELASASLTSPTQSGNGSAGLGIGSNLHTMSADGRYVAFGSGASDLVLGQTPFATDLFVRDVQDNTTARGDDQGPNGVYGLTADGRWLVFSINNSEVWVRDLQTSARVRVSVNAAGTGNGNAPSIVPQISRYPQTAGQQDYLVAFMSLASDLVSGVTKANGPGAPTIYARTLGGSTVLVGGVPNGSATGNGSDFLRDVSPDGRYVIFTSTSTDLVAGLTDTSVTDLFRRDLAASTTTVATAAQPSGNTGVADSPFGRVGQSGGVVFDTGTPLLPADSGTGADIYFAGAIPAPSISGTVTTTASAPIAGVSLVLTGTSSASTTTDAQGAYAFTGLTANGSYVVTPSASGFTFAPPSRSVANILGAQTANFVGTAAGPTLYTISGQVRDLNDTGVEAVTMTLSGSAGATLLTDLDGFYTFSGLAPGGTYTVTPSKSTFTFTPPAQTFPNLQRNEVAAFFVANVGTFTRYFSEGATGAFFDTTIALLNATGSTADVTVRFLKENGTSTTRQLTMAGLARATVDPELLAGTESASFATVISSSQPIIADRRMEWDAAHYGSHAETSIARPEPTWYLAEGATTNAFHLYYLLQNPDPAQSADVEIRYLRPSPLPPIVKRYTVGPATRRTIHVNDEDPGLDEAEISAVVRTLNGVAIIVERAMYTNAGGQLFGAGHESAGIPNLATQWFLAEGATGPFFHLFILVANPGAQDATIEARYLLPDGRVITKPYLARANSRLTIGVHAEGSDLANTPLSTTVTSTNGVPVLVERAMWWPAQAPEWIEGHNSAGVVASGEKWGLADGENGGARNTQTFVLVANTSAQAATVEVTLIFEDGTTAVRTYTIVGNSRFNVHVPSAFPASQGRRFGAVVESLSPGGGAPPAQIVVERSVYSDAGGVTFAAGANAPGTKLR